MGISKMSSPLNRKRVRELLDRFDFKTLFVEELGWDHGGNSEVVAVGEQEYLLTPIAQKKGMIAYEHTSDGIGDSPNAAIRTKILSKAIGVTRENIIVFANKGEGVQYWQWVRKKSGKQDRTRTSTYHVGKSGESLIQKFEELVFNISQEKELTIVDVARQAEKAFDVDDVTAAFYRKFQNQSIAFQQSIVGVKDKGKREWYASLILYRLMFIYFVQRRGFLDSDPDYLTNKFKVCLTNTCGGDTQTYFRKFLLRLFHEGLNRPINLRSSELNTLLGSIPFLNGGLFDIQDIERQNMELNIPDEAIKEILEFFSTYNWHLDDRPTGNDKEINPDVLGYIFERYVNQKEKEKGAFYTKEDVTNYMCRNTIIPWLLKRSISKLMDGTSEKSIILQQFSGDPERYIHDTMKYGKEKIQRKGDHLGNLEREEICSTPRDDTGRAFVQSEYPPIEIALPSETWQAFYARNDKFEELRQCILNSEVCCIDDLITNNINVELFIEDMIKNCNDAKFVLEMWYALNEIRILDPTCGSGAFLFAALNVLQPIYISCLDAMKVLCAKYSVMKNNADSERFEEMSRILSEVQQHSNERYFVLKNIIIQNLFGVDIMPEAIEICKLRLFLKLAAQLDSGEEIEPLPDIDFNVMEGNTLLGFGSEDELRDTLNKNIVKSEELPMILKLTSDVSDAYMEFCKLQAAKNPNASELYSAKRALKAQRDGLRGVLDKYLAGELSDSKQEEVEYDKWRIECKPFHWLAEFYGTMKDGGFDVVIGNPPYVSAKSIKCEMFTACQTKYPDIYGNVVERSMELASRHGYVGMIVPLSLTFSNHFEKLRKRITDWGACWISSYSRRPSMLFVGVSPRSTIWLGRRESKGLYVTPIYRWQREFRQHLFNQVMYTRVDAKNANTDGIPKLYSSLQSEFIENSVYGKIPAKRKIGKGGGKSSLGYSKSGGNYLSIFTRSPPSIDVKSGEDIEPTKVGWISMEDNTQLLAGLAITTGEHFFWHWLVWGDEFDVTHGIVYKHLKILTAIPEEQYHWLSTLGGILDRDSTSYLRFAKNAGRWVGSYDYRSAYRITRRADLIVFASMGWKRDVILDIFKCVQNYLSIADSTRKREVPMEIIGRFNNTQAANNGVLENEEKLLTVIDEYLQEKLDISCEGLKQLIYGDLMEKQGKTQE